MSSVCTDRFEVRHVTAEVVEPEVKLSSLFSRRVFRADDDHVDAVRITDQLIVGRQVRLVAGELKETHAAGAFTPANTRHSLNGLRITTTTRISPGRIAVLRT